MSRKKKLLDRWRSMLMAIVMIITSCIADLPFGLFGSNNTYVADLSNGIHLICM